MALQQAVGLSVPSPRSCGLYSSIPNVIIGIPRFSIVFHWSFLLSASSFIGVSPSESLSFCTAKVYGCGGNERVPAFSLCPEKNNDVVCAFPNIFFVQNFLYLPEPDLCVSERKMWLQPAYFRNFPFLCLLSFSSIHLNFHILQYFQRPSTLSCGYGAKRETAIHLIFHSFQKNIP